MAWPSSLQVALKEWATVCRALETGRQIILLRKGGIYESAGEFEVENREFLLFPTYVHQKLEMLKPSEHADFEPRATEPSQVTIGSAGVVSDIVEIKSRAQMNTLDAEHVWSPALIDIRFDYKPEKPLYLLLLRAYRLHEPVVIENTPAYAGCKSWVPFDQPVQTGNALPVLDDARYEHRRKTVLDRLTVPT